MVKIRKWKHEGVKCKNCGKQAVVKGYCRKCYDNTPERKELHKIESKETYKRKKEDNKYHKEYYHKNKKHREQMKLSYKLESTTPHQG